MKAVILAGGLGQRISEETALRPKPMVEIGGHPILWHIMKGYAAQGVKEFVICLGYRGYVIKDYFARYFLYNSDLTINLKTQEQIIHQNLSEDWKITLIDTGELTMTGGRIKRILPYVKDDPYFCLTYGDAVSDVNIQALVDFHKQHKKKATVTAVQPIGRFGRLEIHQDVVQHFEEKPAGDSAWINGGFFVLNPSIIDSIEGDDSIFERGVLPMLAQNGELAAFKHYGFWQCMDTLRDKVLLDDLWSKPSPPWQTWRE